MSGWGFVSGLRVAKRVGFFKITSRGFRGSRASHCDRLQDLILRYFVQELLVESYINSEIFTGMRREINYCNRCAHDPQVPRSLPSQKKLNLFGNPPNLGCLALVFTTPPQIGQVPIRDIAKGVAGTVSLPFFVFYFSVFVLVFFPFRPCVLSVFFLVFSPFSWAFFSALFLFSVLFWKNQKSHLFIILLVRNFWRVCSQFWLSVRNSVWGPFNGNSRGNPSLFWLGRILFLAQKLWTKLLWTNWRFLKNEAAPRPPLFRGVRQFVWNHLESVSCHFCGRGFWSSVEQGTWCEKNQATAQQSNSSL